MSIKNQIRTKIKNVLGINVLEKELKALTTRDLVNTLEKAAHLSSAELIEKKMILAKPLDSTFNVINYALGKIPADWKGLFCEFGVFRGNTINHIARQTKSKVYGFDSFSGLPEQWRNGYPAGAFDVTNDLPKCESNVELVVGWFDKTLPGFVTQHQESVAFLHVDCDLYSSTKTVFAHLGKRLVSGSVIVFDEYFNYPGWQEHEYKAFNEFIEDSNRRFEYLCYNRFDQQVAVQIL